MRMRSIVACTAALAASISASYGGPCWDDLTAVQAKIDAVLEAKLPTGHLRLPKPWPEQALNRHRIRWKPLRKGWAKYRLRRSMLLGKPWRVRVLPMTLATRPHASKLWPTCGALLVSSLQTTWMTSANDAVSVPTR